MSENGTPNYWDYDIDTNQWTEIVVDDAHFIAIKRAYLSSNSPTTLYLRIAGWA